MTMETEGSPDCYKKVVICLCGNLKDVDGNYIPQHTTWMESSTDTAWCPGRVDSKLGDW
jgi:hypothetical protein